MPDRPQNEESTSISEQAADWLVLVRAGEMSDQEKLDYIHWLKKSPAHIREMLELVNLEEMVRETHPPPPQAEAPSEASKVVDLPAGKQQEEADLEMPAEKCER
jgi:ferric-dicitrate binding protein FerR (iron transport regulator)